MIYFLHKGGNEGRSGHSKTSRAAAVLFMQEVYGHGEINASRENSNRKSMSRPALHC